MVAEGQSSSLIDWNYSLINEYLSNWLNREGSAGEADDE
jgi:hypothetical protein